MNPNTFLKSLWRTEILDQVFVAMSFERRFDDRFKNIIKPAIEDEPIAGHELIAYRVDNSKTGDSILTDIADGIAHSRIVLADVSVIDEGRSTKAPIRNGNVMYEVGVALASRSPSEVLLIRDDSERFLFDVSTVPHITIDFSDSVTAIEALRSAIEDRIKETDLVEDARVKIAARRLNADEIRVLEIMQQSYPNQPVHFTHPELGMPSNPDQRGLDGLLQKGCIMSVGIKEESGAVFYMLTPFGHALAEGFGKLIQPA